MLELDFPVNDAATIRTPLAWGDGCIIEIRDNEGALTLRVENASTLERLLAACISARKRMLASHARADGTNLATMRDAAAGHPITYNDAQWTAETLETYDPSVAQREYATANGLWIETELGRWRAAVRQYHVVYTSYTELVAGFTRWLEHQPSTSQSA